MLGFFILDFLENFKTKNSISLIFDILKIIYYICT
jgi:hypothetical protein